MEKTFLHSGDMGDIVVSMCAMRELGGGVLYIDTTGGLNTGEFAKVIQIQTLGKGLKMNDRVFEFIKPILEVQPYVTRVEKYAGEKIDFDLNRFRVVLTNVDIVKQTGGNLFLANCVAWGFNKDVVNNPWMFVDGEKKLDRPYAIARSSRYQGGHIFYRASSLFLEKNAYFIGTEFERSILNNAIETDIPLYDCQDALDMALVIRGADCVMANSTFQFWLALALGHKNILHECCPDLAASLFKNHPNIRNFIGMRCEKEKNK